MIIYEEIDNIMRLQKSYYQILCVNGHYDTISLCDIKDSTFHNYNCLHCFERIAWFNFVEWPKFQTKIEIKDFVLKNDLVWKEIRCSTCYKLLEYECVKMRTFKIPTNQGNFVNHENNSR